MTIQKMYNPLTKLVRRIKENMVTVLITCATASCGASAPQSPSRGGSTSYRSPGQGDEPEARWAPA